MSEEIKEIPLKERIEKLLESGWVNEFNYLESQLQEARYLVVILQQKIDTLKIEISSLMSRYFYEKDFYIEDTHLDKLLRIIDNDIVLRGSDKE